MDNRRQVFFTIIQCNEFFCRRCCVPVLRVKVPIVALATAVIYFHGTTKIRLGHLRILFELKGWSKWKIFAQNSWSLIVQFQIGLHCIHINCGSNKKCKEKKYFESRELFT
jgi:hypothetical protein